MKQNSFSRRVLGLFFIAAGALHFIRPYFYLKIMPTWVPFPFGMVLMSGLFEILLGWMVFHKKTLRLAGWGLIALLMAVFPANIHMTHHPELFSGIPPAVLWARLPFQGVFIVWVWAVCLKPSSCD